MQRVIISLAQRHFVILRILICVFHNRHCWNSHRGDLGDVHSNQQLCGAVLATWSWSLHKHNCHRLLLNLCGSRTSQGGALHPPCQDCSHCSPSGIWYIQISIIIRSTFRILAMAATYNPSQRISEILSQVTQRLYMYLSDNLTAGCTNS